MINSRARDGRSTTEEAAGIQLIRLCVGAGILAGLSRTWADPDLWGHVRFGADIVSSGTLPRSDPYSFTSDISWVNHEWLAELVMYLAYHAGGGAGLIALKMALLGSTLALVAAAIRRTVAAATRDLVLVVAAVGLWARVFVVRPQIFSLALFAALLWILLSAERGRPGRLWLLPAIFALWSNLHGGWIVGLAALLLWTGIALSPWDRGDIPRWTIIGSVALAVGGTAVNPYGFELWSFIASTVRVDRPNINDWRPLAEAGVQVIVPWLATTGLTVAAFVRGRTRVPFAHAVLVVGLGVASLRVSRLDAFFTLSAAMLLAPHLAGAGLSRARPAWTRRTTGAAIMLGLALLVAAWRARPELSCVRLDGPWMPERAAGALVASNAVGGRMLTWFAWGQYVIWHAAPRVQVSLDGRRETVYSDALVARHLQWYFEPDPSLTVLDTLRPDIAWLPADLPLTRALDRAGWHRLFTGPLSVIFSRAPGRPPAEAPLAKRACFPGP